LAYDFLWDGVIGVPCMLGAHYAAILCDVFISWRVLLLLSVVLLFCGLDSGRYIINRNYFFSTTANYLIGGGVAQLNKKVD